MTTIRSVTLRRQADEQRKAWREFCDRPTSTVIYEDEPPPAVKPPPRPDPTRRLDVEESKALLAKLLAEGTLRTSR